MEVFSLLISWLVK